MTTYRAKCSLCHTEVRSTTKDGRFTDYQIAVKAMHAHLKHSSEHAGEMKKRHVEAVAVDSIAEMR